MPNIDHHPASSSPFPGDEFPPEPLLPRLSPGLLFENFKQSLPILAAVFAVASVLLGMVFVFHHTLGIAFGDLTRDPSAVYEFSFYIGFLSQTGIFFWAAAATACLLAGAIFLRLPDRRQMAAFFFASAFLSLMLGLDDVFLFHEVVYPHFGIPEKVVYGIYAALVLGYLWFFRSILLNTRFIILAMGFGFFAMSVGMDIVDPQGIDPFLLEDGAKMIGIVCWLGYFSSTAFTALARATDQAWNSRLFNPLPAAENVNPTPANLVPSPARKRFRPARRVQGVSKTSLTRRS